MVCQSVQKEGILIWMLLMLVWYFGFAALGLWLYARYGNHGNKGDRRGNA